MTRQPVEPRRMARPRGELRRQMARPARGGQHPADDHWSDRDGHWSDRQRRRLSLRRLVGPTVLVIIGGAAIGGMVGLPSASLPPPGAAATAAVAPTSVAQLSPPLTATATPRPTARSGGSSAVATPRTAPTPTPALTPAPTPTLPVPSASPTPRPRDWAPQSAAGFDRSGEVIDIAFPLKQTRYHFRDNWHRWRAGEPEPYNHVLARRRGELRRAHDGIDIYTRPGSPVVAPFAGTVVDPATRWQPWRKERYGRTVVIVSNEPQSAGYAALMAHLDAAFVAVGTVVRRGEVIGLAGVSGNAEGSRVHLHFELRAPFLVSWPEAGDVRLLDAFNPYPSLTRADPKRD